MERRKIIAKNKKKKKERDGLRKTSEQRYEKTEHATPHAKYMQCTYMVLVDSQMRAHAERQIHA